MVEIRESFSSLSEWVSFRDSLGDVAAIGAEVVADVRRLGFEEPLTGLRRRPDEIRIATGNLHESIGAHELNARKRALLLQVDAEIAWRRGRSRRDLRILSADALTRPALILRGRYPFFYGGENLATEQAKKDFFPIPHLDLRDTQLPDDSFDVIVDSEALERLSGAEPALLEIHRVLKPGGTLISSFPFDLATRETAAQADENATGWDVLERLKAIGFEDAYFTVRASSHYGVASDGRPGPFVLTATKPGADGRARVRPPAYVHRRPLPEKLCALIALPRSGTTLITSVFSVHSRCVAVFEPWNSQREPAQLPPTLDAISNYANVPDLSGKMLFVKETATSHEYVVKLRKLVETTPDFVAKHVLVALRDPAQTFVSEVSRRNEWWGADVSVNQEAFKNWAARSRSALRLIVEFATHYDGLLIALGAFAAAPEQALQTLGSRIGFAVEPAQLEYEKHVNLKIVRGDRNIGQSPAPIDAAKVNFRNDSVERIQPFLTDERERRWFEAFQSFYEHVAADGGILPISAIPPALRSQLVLTE